MLLPEIRSSDAVEHVAMQYNEILNMHYGSRRDVEVLSGALGTGFPVEFTSPTGYACNDDIISRILYICASNIALTTLVYTLKASV